MARYAKRTTVSTKQTKAEIEDLREAGDMNKIYISSWGKIGEGKGDALAKEESTDMSARQRLIVLDEEDAQTLKEYCVKGYGFWHRIAAAIDRGEVIPRCPVVVSGRDMTRTDAERAQDDEDEDDVRGMQPTLRPLGCCCPDCAR